MYSTTVMSRVIEEIDRLDNLVAVLHLVAFSTRRHEWPPAIGKGRGVHGEISVKNTQAAEILLQVRNDVRRWVNDLEKFLDNLD